MPPLNKLSKTCIAAAVLHAIVMPTAHAASLVVTNTGDGLGSCTLRDAITSANTATNTGNCVATDGVLGSNDQITFDLPVPSTISLVNGPLEITADYLSIAVPNLGNIEIDASSTGAAFNLIDANYVSLSGLKITQGNVIATNSVVLSILGSSISGNSSSGYGGGVFLDNCDFATIAGSEISNNIAYAGGGISILESNSVTIESTTISGNTAVGGGALTRGGGISFATSETADGDDQNLFILDSSIIGNSSERGGGIFSSSTSTVSAPQSNVFIYDSQIINNDGSYRGGGIALSSPNSNNKIVSTTISDNYARDGGGVFLGRTTFATIDRSTISNNSAYNGGGISAEALVITNSTISSNSAEYNGSGIYNKDYTSGSIEITSSTITGNRGDSGLRIYRTSYGNGSDSLMILQNNVISNHEYGNCAYGGSSLPPVVGSFNWIDDDTCGVPNSGDPKLGELADNGGPTKTHAPLPGSGLRGAGLLSICNGSLVNGADQRGQPRGSTSCFIGAVEGIVDLTSFFVIPLANGKSVVIPL